MTKPPLDRALLGEFLGTALLVTLGDGVVAAAVLMGKQADWIVITTGWGLAVALSVYAVGRLSGAHLNPAVSLALAVRGDFPYGRVLPYCLAQLAGGFVGAIVVYVEYYSAFAKFAEKEHVVIGQLVQGRLPDPAAGGAGVFTTFPAYPSVWGNVFSEVLATAVLLFGIRALTDRRNAAPVGYIEPLLIGALVWAIGLSLGGPTGYAINPARDLGPRLAAAMLGWGMAVFQSHAWYFWIPIVAPLVGGIVGASVYDVAIHRNLPSPADPSPPGELSP
jgi:glycerol uptake facilitator protein